MENIRYYIVATDDDGNMYYAYNTSPMMWASSICICDGFSSYEDTLSEIGYNRDILQSMLNKSSINGIYIVKYAKDIETIIGKEKVI